MKWIVTAILLLATFGAASAETKEEEAARYLETLVASIEEGNDPMRNRMFIKLRYLGTPSIEPLLGALGGDSPDVRRYAAFTLGFFDDPSVVDPSGSAGDGGGEPSGAPRPRRSGGWSARRRSTSSSPPSPRPTRRSGSPPHTPSG